MVAFGFLPQKFGRWQGPMNGTLSFYECRFSGGELVGAPNPYLMQNNLFELFARTGGKDAKNSGTSVCALR